MHIRIITPKGQYRSLSISLSFITFLFCCMIVLSAGAVLLGVLFQLSVLISPFLIVSGGSMLKFSAVIFLSYRFILWLWRFVIRRLWIGAFVYRRTLFVDLQRHVRMLLKVLAVILFR